MERYFCVDCHARLGWYESYVLGHIRCPVCQDVQEEMQRLDRVEAANGVADEAIIEQQITVPLEVRDALERFAKPWKDFGVVEDKDPSELATAPLRPPQSATGATVKLQPVLLEVASGRLECGVCGALAVVVRLVHGPACDDPALYDYAALCQAHWIEGR